MHGLWNVTLGKLLNSPVKPAGPELLFVGVFWITDSISLLVISLFRFSVSS